MLFQALQASNLLEVCECLLKARVLSAVPPYFSSNFQIFPFFLLLLHMGFKIIN